MNIQLDKKKLNIKLNQPQVDLNPNKPVNITVPKTPEVPYPKYQTKLPQYAQKKIDMAKKMV